MINTYMAGLIFGFIIAFVIFLVLSFLHRKDKKAHYDERQQLIRGEGFKISFAAVTILNLMYSLVAYDYLREIISPQIVIIANSFIGVLIYTVYCIFNDAYMQVGQKTGKWVALICLVIFCNGSAVYVNRDRGLSFNGYVNGSLLNIIIIIFFSAILISFFIKQLLERKCEHNEES